MMNAQTGKESISLHDHFRQIIDERTSLFSEKFRSIREAVVLAREQMEHRLNGMNEFQKRMDKLEGTFATKPELRAVERLVYIGVGIVLALQFILGIYIMLRKG